jgi:hypothetical protein
MQLYLVREVAPEKAKAESVSRPAKVVQLEARRLARLEAERREQSRPRPAA